MSLPTLVVVGRTNKGKSSVVATLAGIRPGPKLAVGPKPGTTTDAHPYPMSVDGVDLVRFVDTPGLEEAPRARAWLAERAASAAERPAALARLVAEFADGSDFREEVRALRPIIEGGGILYVVDGTQPYRPRAEAEMEVLQWAARPRLALINRLRHPESGAAERVDANVQDWRNALSQYFSTVVEFDAHRATFTQRVELFETLAAIDAQWREAMREVVQALKAQRAQQNRAAAQIIAELLAEAVSHRATRSVGKGASEADREALYQVFHEDLVDLELQARRAVEAAFGHGHFQGDEGFERAPYEEDLFAEGTWKVFGLSPGNLIVLATGAGAAAGGVADLHVGLASWGAGAIGGGVVMGALAAWRVGKRFAEVSMDSPLGFGGALRGERRLEIGPHPNPNFGWVLLGRALQHLELVRNWAHARPTDEAGEVYARIGNPVEAIEEPKPIHKLLAALRKKPTPQLRSELHAALLEVVTRQNQV